MKYQTHEKLEKLRAEVGKEYGKLVQKLLAIAFLETDVKKLVERSSQGIDLQLEIAGERYVFEVKTSEGDSIRLGAKDLEGLDRHVEERAKAYWAVLINGPFEDWILARYVPGEFPTATDLTSFPFRAHRDLCLEERIHKVFEIVVDAHLDTAIKGRQRGLDQVLEGYAERRLA